MGYKRAFRSLAEPVAGFLFDALNK